MSSSTSTVKQAEYRKEWNTYAWTSALLLFTFFLVDPARVSIVLILGLVAVLALQNAIRPSAPSHRNLYLWGAAALLFPLYTLGGHSELVLAPLLAVLVAGTVYALLDDPPSDW